MAKPSSSVQPLEWEEVQEMEQGCKERENEYGDEEEEEEDRLDAHGLHCSQGLVETRTHSDSFYARLQARLKGSGCAPLSRRSKIRVLLPKRTMAMTKKKYPEELEQCCNERENESEDSPIFFDPPILHSRSLLDIRDDRRHESPTFLFSLLDLEDSSSDEDDRLDAALRFSHSLLDLEDSSSDEEDRLDAGDLEDSSSDEEDRLDAGLRFSHRLVETTEEDAGLHFSQGTRADNAGLHFSQGTRADNDSLLPAAPDGSWSNFHPIYEGKSRG